MTTAERPGTMRVVKRLYEEIERLDVASRWAMARKNDWPPALTEVFEALGWLMCRPAETELVRVAAALVEAVTRMTPQARSVFVQTVYRADADMKHLQPVYDRLAELVAVVDGRLRDG